MRIFKPVKGKLPDEIISASKTYNLDTLYQINWLIYNHKAEIEALHKVECPNCGWNGKELVFKETENENDRNIR